MRVDWAYYAVDEFQASHDINVQRPSQLQRQASVASSTDTGHYDEIGNDSIKSPTPQDGE